MTPWFNAERIVALQKCASHWLGTPFVPNACSRGHGVSCQKLAGAIYRELGFCDLLVPDVAMTHARFCRRSVVREFLASRPEFASVQLLPIFSGDLLGFRTGYIVHHLGIALGPDTFVHAYRGSGVRISPLSDPTWQLEAVWRPIE